MTVKITMDQHWLVHDGDPTAAWASRPVKVPDGGAASLHLGSDPKKKAALVIQQTILFNSVEELEDFLQCGYIR